MKQNRSFLRLQSVRTALLPAAQTKSLFACDAVFWYSSYFFFMFVLWECSRVHHSGEASEPASATTQGLSAYFLTFVCIRIRGWCCINLAYSRPKEKLLQRLTLLQWQTLLCSPAKYFTLKHCKLYALSNRQKYMNNLRPDLWNMLKRWDWGRISSGSLTLSFLRWNRTR